MIFRATFYKTFVILLALGTGSLLCVSSQEKINHCMKEYRLLPLADQQELKTVVALIDETLEQALKKAVDVALNLEHLKNNPEAFQAGDVLEVLDIGLGTVRPLVELINDIFRSLQRVVESSHNSLSIKGRGVLCAMIESLSPEVNADQMRMDPQMQVMSSVAKVRSTLQKLLQYMSTKK